MPRRNKYFFGDDGNDVDIAQRHAPGTLSSAGDDATENIVGAALAARPKARSNDGVKAKRLEDNIRDAQAGYDTTPDDDSLLRQENIPSARTNEPVPDESTDWAERTVRSLQAGPMKHYGMFADPVQRAKFVERLARSHRGGPATPETQPEEQEKPFSSNEFWNDPAELQKAAKQARPRRL